MPDEPTPSPKDPASPGHPHPGGTQRAPGEGMSRQARSPLAFLVLVVLLCLGGWLLVSWMSDTTKLQDCVMSGRRNCVEMDPKLGR